MRTTKNINLFYRVASLIFLCSITFFSSCKKDDGPTAHEINEKLLSSGTWKISSLTVDGADHTSLFTGMTLQFQANTFTAVNATPVWPNSDTWTFKDDKAMAFTRGDGTEVTITSISETNLVLSLTWNETTLGGGRVSSIEGPHVFTFTK